MLGLFFTASWCSACRAMHPIIAKLKNEGYSITEIDVDKEKEKAEKYAITSLPTVVVLQNTKIIKRFVGKTTEEELKKVPTKNDYQIW